ncbi:hypothetical protein KIH39_12705 [Telmatocola sphagniphila]|uniref:Uncharacterized protein n=1 Tax=Telmatocola sphagniphila TaxID=1123043 RepID=A0A8E6BB77_9BACT|nr:hypothetical protein [Telmatocola sphagniphila]QVL34727.1 hypothetical protein KIH39_12705 [Telmatocola sphagniphila]
MSGEKEQNRKVKCGECGFCHLYNSERDVELEFSLRDRKAGDTGLSLECFKNMVYLDSEKYSAPKDLDRRGIVKFILNQERDCQEFTPYMSGFTAKEHVRVQWERKQIELAAAQLEDQKSFNAKMAKAQEEFNKEQNYWNRVVAITFGILATITAVASVFSPLIHEWLGISKK